MKYSKFLFAGLCALCLAACRTEQWEGMEGGFLISLGEGVEASTKATPAELGEPLAGLFQLKIVNESTNATLYEGAYTASTISASAGSYAVTAHYGDNPVLDWDAPYYKGEATGVTVEQGATTSVQLACSVANALASVTFNDSERFASTYSDYGVKVTVGTRSATLTDGDSRSAYYQAGSMPAFQFVGTLKDNGQEVSTGLTGGALEDAATFAAGKHCKLNLSLQETAAGVILAVEKVEVENVAISETIPASWLPKPKVEAGEGFANNALSFTETVTAAASVKLNMSSTLQDLRLNFNFEDAQFTALNRDTGYLVSNAEDKAAIEALGITLPALGAAEAAVDLSGLTTLLQTNAGTATANAITVDVQANNRWSSEDTEANRTYTLTCNKPEFSVSAYPGNIWTKEFTMNALMEDQVTSGNYSTLSANMAYQFSTDGSDWSDLEDDLRKADLTPNTTYYIRGLYRGAVASDAVAVKTYPVIELENGDMEDWTAEERGYYFKAFGGSSAPKLRVYYPWEGDSYWNTNNDFTTRYRDASIASISTVYYYNSFPAVSYTKDTNGGTWAAELRNTAAGRGNISSSKSSYDFNNVPGELFIGDINVTTSGTAALPDDSYEIVKGKAFASRPTGIRFYYKYAPYTTDSWKAYIVLYDESDNIIAENTVTNGDTTNSYTKVEIPFNYIEDPNIIPAKIYIYFASSIYSGSSLPYHSTDVTTWYGDSQRTDTTLSGSVLTLDDISLVYDK